MKIKIKILIGLIFLVVITVLIGGLGAYFIKRLGDDSNAIIKDNYKSVEYARQMLYALDEIHSMQTTTFVNQIYDTITKSKTSYQDYRNLFTTNLDSEMDNFTEAGEKELAIDIKFNFEKYISLIDRSFLTNSDECRLLYSESAVFYDQLQKQLLLLSGMNMQAIIRKNERAHETTKDITFSILIIGLLPEFCMNIVYNDYRPL